MRLVQVITDYIRRSILTTQGDLVVRGVGQPERLAAGIVGTLLKGKGAGVEPVFEDLTGAIGTVLQGQGAGVEPAFGVPRLSDYGMKTGFFTRSTVGDEVVSGVGFRPSLCFLLARDSTETNDNWSIGIDFVTGKISLCEYEGGACIDSRGDYTVFIRRDGLNLLYGSILEFNADGFRMGFLLTGTVSILVRWFVIQ